MNKTCPVCGTMFSTKYANKIYCCEACGNRALKRKKAGRAISDEEFKIESQNLSKICICAWCGKEFKKHPQNRLVYCSDECQRLGKAKYKKEHEMKTRYNKKYHLEHREQRSKERKAYRQAHLEEMRARERQREAKYRHSNINRRVKSVQRKLVRRCLKSTKLDKTSNILGYSPRELRTHLELYFYNDMSWDNKSSWEVHHIKPICEYNTVNEDGTDNYEEIAKANALSNLIPLFKEDHQKVTSLYKQTKIYLTRDEIYDMLDIMKERRENEQD